MADDEGHGGILPKNPKQKKVMMIGVGIAALLIVFLMFRSRSSSSTAAAPQTQAAPQQPIADVTVPSDQQSSSDLLAQWATSMQALQQYANTNKTSGTSQPGAPPSQGSDPGPNQIGGFWYTFQQGDNPTTVTENVYDQPASAPWLAVDQEEIMSANPQINWQQTIQPGTPVYIPPMPWNTSAGPKPALTANESWSQPGITAANNSS